MTLDFVLLVSSLGSVKLKAGFTVGAWHAAADNAAHEQVEAERKKEEMNFSLCHLTEPHKPVRPVAFSSHYRVTIEMNDQSKHKDLIKGLVIILSCWATRQQH